MVRLTDRPDMTLDVYRGRKTTMQYNTFERGVKNPSTDEGDTNRPDNATT